MGILHFIKTKQLNHWAIALDIGTEFIKAIVFEVKDGHAIVRGVGRARQRLADMQGGVVSDIAGVIKTCEKALEIAVEKSQVLPKQVIIGIAGELVKGTTTLVHYERPKPKNHIELAELKEIITNVQKEAFNEARRILAWETGHAEIDVRLVNAAIVDVKIDGYKVTNPLGFQGKDVEVGVFNAFAPIVHLGALQTIAEELELDLLSVAPEPYAVARAVSEEQSVEFSAIFLDIGGGTTDVALVRAGGIEGTKMFAMGGRTFTKRIAEELGVSFTKAEEIKLEYSDNSLPEKKMKEIEEFLELDTNVWLEGLKIVLEEFSAQDLLPSRILLCGGGSALPDIFKILHEGNWAKELPFARTPTVQFIKPHDVARVDDDEAARRTISDITPMALANLAIDLVGSPTAVGGLLVKVADTLRS
ncbi:ethanolamine ammonia-lyase reactivating factor EutA [Candidatus Berkelbacteria bacterium]|nr:ethanolamine ammonia-lyase reactivating factor EutA [Candidatus Berkelbacteria bacterium]